MEAAGEKHQGQMEGRVICSPESMAQRGRDDRETPPGIKEQAGTTSLPQTQHKHKAICGNQHPLTLLRIGPIQSHFLCPSVVGPFPQKTAQNTPTPHLLTCTTCRTSVPEVAEGLILQADQHTPC